MSKFDHKLELHCFTICFITAPFSASIGEWERVAPVIYRTSFFSRTSCRTASEAERNVLLKLLADEEAKGVSDERPSQAALICIKQPPLRRD